MPKQSNYNKEMKNIKILDCTLRDGGYVNDWCFGKENINKILFSLYQANIDYIECGYLNENTVFDNNKCIYQNISQIENPTNNLAIMINYGEFSIENIPDNCEIIFRIAFKEKDYKNALEFCKQLKNKKCSFFINPMHTNFYNKENLLDLINTTNKLKPIALTITDTIGAMNQKETLEIFNFIDKNLDENISICFHSHNNLNLSFLNAKTLIEACKNRELILDTTVFGIGRGAGNLKTEFLAEYLKSKYDIKLLSKIKDEIIFPVYDKHAWGFNEAYQISALYKLHPNYARFLIEKNVKIEQTKKILSLISDKEKLIYNKKLIESLYCTLI